MGSIPATLVLSTHTQFSIDYSSINLRGVKTDIKHFELKTIFNASIQNINLSRVRTQPRVSKKTGRQSKFVRYLDYLTPKQLLSSTSSSTYNSYASSDKLIIDNTRVSYVFNKKKLELLWLFYLQHTHASKVSLFLHNGDVKKWKWFTDLFFDHSRLTNISDFWLFKKFNSIFSVCQQAGNIYNINKKFSVLDGTRSLEFRQTNSSVVQQFSIYEAQKVVKHTASRDTTSTLLCVKTLLWEKIWANLNPATFNNFQNTMRLNLTDTKNNNNCLFRHLLKLSVRSSNLSFSLKSRKYLYNLCLFLINKNSKKQRRRLKVSSIYGLHHILTKTVYFWTKNSKILEKRYKKLLFFIEKQLTFASDMITLSSNIDNKTIGYSGYKNNNHNYHARGATTPVFEVLNKWAGSGSLDNILYTKTQTNLQLSSKVTKFVFSLFARNKLEFSNLNSLHLKTQIRSIAAYSRRVRMPGFIIKRYDLNQHDFSTTIQYKNEQSENNNNSNKTGLQSFFKHNMLNLPKTMHISNVRYWASIFLFKVRFKELFLLGANTQHASSFPTTTFNVSGLPLNFARRFHASNIYPNYPIVRISTKKTIKLLFDSSENVESTVIYTARLTRFVQNITGKSVFIKLQFGDCGLITMTEFILFLVWAKRIFFFKKTISNVLHIEDSLQIVWVALKTHDTSLFLYWIKNIMTRITSWKHRNFFSYIKYIFATFITPLLSTLNIIGVQLLLKGKISVAGNARTRKIMLKFGNASFTTLAQKVSYSHSTVSTFTGVLGVHIWFFYV